MERKFLPVLFLLASFILAGCSDNVQNITGPADQVTLEKVLITCFNGTEVSIEQLDPGTVKIHRGKYMLTRQVTRYRFETDSDMMTGINILTHNAIFDMETGEGFAYGSLLIKPDAYNGTWEGNYHGKTIKTGESEWTTHSQMVGTGKGDFLGMQMYYFNNVIIHERPATSITASGHGCIKQNGVSEPGLL